MTTTNLTRGEQMVRLIKSEPHWRTQILPSTAAERFPTKSAARDAALSSTVALRGWDYPHFQRNQEHGGNGPVPGGWESWTDFYDREAWRIMQSGQFVHYITMREERSERQPPDSDTLGFISAVWQLTEFFEFAARLTAEADYGAIVSLRIRLSGTGDRRLIGTGRRHLFGDYFARQPVIEIGREIDVTRLQHERRDIALNAAHELFEWFGFEPVPGLLREIQDDLFQKRF